MLDKPQEMRDKAVALARDVISRLEVGKIKVNYGFYIRGLSDLFLSGSLQNCVDEIEENCEVCQLGALFLSYARLYNDIHSSETGTRYMFNRLTEAFLTREIIEIESAFEGNDNGTHNWLRLDYSYDKDHNSPTKVCNAIDIVDTDSARHRVYRICEEIIDNDGVFDPVGRQRDTKLKYGLIESR